MGSCDVKLSRSHGSPHGPPFSPLRGGRHVRTCTVATCITPRRSRRGAVVRASVLRRATAPTGGLQLGTRVAATPTVVVDAERSAVGQGTVIEAGHQRPPA